MNEALESSNLSNNSGANSQANMTNRPEGGVQPDGAPTPRDDAGRSGTTPLTDARAAGATEPGSASGANASDRRRRRRALISAPIRVRGVDVTEDGPDEISTTLDVSRNGLLFATSLDRFAAGMEVAVTFPYTKTPGVVQAEQPGRVVRVSEIFDGRWSVAIALGVGVGEDLVDAAGRILVAKDASATCEEKATEAEKPLVLVVDADPAIRTSLKSSLACDGYKVFAVSNAKEAHEILKMFTPALLIAEIEGEDLPGYELCAHCKSTPRLRTVPVMLLTSSAYPSDYANAHSLGAVVCMAKPYRQERLAHVVRLLAPTQQAKTQGAPARPADPSRRACRSKKPGASEPPQERRRWLF